MIKNKITCIITDDEPYARKGLQKYVEKVDFLQLLMLCKNVSELQDILTTHKPDLLFLDVQMPGKSGIDFLRSCPSPPQVIFTTAFEKFALEGFELEALDYLLKPISFSRFKKAAMRAQRFFEKNDQSPAEMYFFVKTKGQMEKINFEDILFIKGMENYLAIYTHKKKIIVHKTIKAILEKLPEKLFLQCHKSYVVAINKIDSLDGNALIVCNHSIPIGRIWKEMILKKILTR